MFSYIECLIFLILVILLALTSLHLSNKAKQPKLPPSPPRLPIIGNLHQLGKLPHQSLYKLSQKYGPVMLLQLGKIPTIVISSPEMAKQILKVHDSNFCSRPQSPGPKKLAYNLSDVAFSPYNDQWKVRRKLLSFEFLNSKKSLTFWKFKREEVVRKLIESLSSEASQKNTINFDEKMFQIMGELVTSVAFGKCYNEYQFKNGNQEELKDILCEISAVIHSFSAEDYFPSILGRIIDTLSGHRWKLNKCFAKTDGYFETILRDHIDKQERSRGDLADDLVDVLIRSSNDLSGHLGSDHIKAMCLNIFVGGIDTNSNTIVWAMTELIRNQRVMKKVQDGIRSFVGKKEKLEEKDIGEFNYLKMVVKETLRLHPPGPLLVPREAMQSCKIADGSDYVIQPKTRILVNAWAVARDPLSWKDPNKFFPERFEESDIDFKATFQLIPFGAGRRVCPGLSISIIIMECILANLLYFFDWEVPDGMEMEDVSLEEAGGVTIHKKIPLSLKPIKYF